MRLFGYVILPVGFLLLALVVFRLVLPACAALPMVGKLFPSRCPGANIATADTALRAERDRGAALRSRIGQLERGLMALGNCPIPERRAEAPFCPPERMPPPPNEVVFLIDASKSMEAGIDAPRTIDEELTRLSAGSRGIRARDRARFDELVREARSPRYGESRISFTRRALIAALDQVDVGPMRVGSFNACGRLAMSVRLTDERRARSLIEAIRLGNYTALADAIRLTAAMVTSGTTAEDPVNVVLVSDGYDTCGGDPCAAARAVRSSHPGLRFNVIDLVGLPDLRCVAEETGGFYQVKPAGVDISALAEAIRAAAQTAPGACLPETNTVAPEEPSR